MKKTSLLAVGLMATAVLTGCATKADGERNDKLESFNRTMFDFNYKVMDRYVLEQQRKAGVITCRHRSQKVYPMWETTWTSQ